MERRVRPFLLTSTFCRKAFYNINLYKQIQILQKLDNETLCFYDGIPEKYLISIGYILYITWSLTC